MEFVIAIIIIVAAYSALITYSFWYFFLSREAVLDVSALSHIWHNITQTRNFMPSVYAGKFASSDPEAFRLKKKLKELKCRRALIIKQLNKQYDTALLRDLNIVQQKIEVTQNRIGVSFTSSSNANTTFYKTGKL